MKIGMVGPALLGMVCAGFFGCTVANPDYQEAPEGDQGVTPQDGGQADRSQVGEGGAADGDGQPPPDTVPTPDSTPWQCEIDQDCDDQRVCTEDVCAVGKVCQLTLRSDYCLIDGACYTSGQSPAGDDCRQCQPNKDPAWWSAVPDGTACAGDSLSCTDDVCQQGSCEHPVADGDCLIDGQCVSAGQLNPQNTCQKCDGASDATGWTAVADNSTCAADGFSCTADICLQGTCSHPVTTGCLVDGACRDEGWSANGDPCWECAPPVSTSTLTFVAGKECSGNSKAPGMCLQNGCWTWTERLLERPNSGGGSMDLATVSLDGVDYIAADQTAWAAGGYKSTFGTGGLLVPLSANITAKDIVVTDEPLQGIHYRLAVGDDGQAYYHDGKKWVEEESVAKALEGGTRTGVWGAALGGAEVFFLSDYQTYDRAGMIRCDGSGGAFTCQEHQGVQTGVFLGRVFGVLSGGALAGVWAARTADDEDIFFNDGTSKSWSRTSPEGCEDSSFTGQTPCSGTSGDFRDLYASAGHDVWVVGSEGLVMRYDGSQWQRLTGLFNQQSSYDLDAVFSSTKEGLVTVAAHRDTYWGTDVMLFNYSSTVQRWLGPLVISEGANGSWGSEVRDIGGQGYDALWMVGRKVDVGGRGGFSQKGWVLRLTAP